MNELIGRPLGWIMWLLYQITHNYAWSIVFFTLITRILLFPLSVKQQKSMAAMTAFQPKLEKLKKQYANNQQKLQEEQMKLYAEEGINPMASCLPTFIQIPLMYGVYYVVICPITHIIHAGNDIIIQAKELIKPLYTNASGVTDANFNARPETYIIKEIQRNPAAFESLNNPEFVEKVKDFKNMLFGVVDLGDIPTMHPEVWNASAVILVAIPIISGLIQLFMTVYQQIRTKKMNPETPSMAGMNIMFYLMPLMFVWIGFKAPAGLGFYWALSSLFGCIQSMLLYKIYTPEYVASLVEKDKAKRKKKARPNLMERYQKLMEEQMAQAQQQNGGTVQSPAKTGGITVSSAADEEEEDKPEVKISKAKQKEYERMIIREARRRQAEKYGEEFIDDED